MISTIGLEEFLILHLYSITNRYRIENNQSKNQSDRSTSRLKFQDILYTGY